jgi:deoxyribonucleoside regulator
MEDIETRNALLARVAFLFFDNKMSQQEIADSTGISRAMVTRMVNEARERGVVEIVVHFPWRSKSLEMALIKTFGLRAARVMVMDDQSPSEILSGLGRLAAKYVNPMLHDDMVIGISWGTVIQRMIQTMPTRKMREVEIVQLIGANGLESNLSNGPLLAQLLTDRLGATCRYLNAPLIVETKAIHDSLLQDDNIKETLARGAQANIALVGVGSIHPDLYSLKIAGYVTEEQRQQMVEDGVVGDFCGHHFSIDGKCPDIDINQRSICVDMATLAKISSVIAVAGDIRKGDAILGALRGKFFDTLITDAVTAKYLIENA